LNGIQEVGGSTPPGSTIVPHLVNKPYAAAAPVRHLRGADNFVGRIADAKSTLSQENPPVGP
jgi:hypothetical protein